MPNTLGNRVKMSVSGTPGTGTITLGSAVSGFQTFAAAGISNAATVPYVLEDGSNWEIGVGTYTSSGTTLARTSITASSNSGSAISATSSAIVMISPLAADLQSTDTLTSGTLGVARGGTGIATLTANRIPYGNGTSAFQSNAGLTTDGTSITTTTDSSFNSVKVGKGANSVSGCTALGESALNTNSSGVNNTAIGYQSLTSTTAAANTGVGYQTLYTNAGGYNNVAIGWKALYTNLSGNFNVAIGYQALYLNSTGTNNTTFGYQSGYNITGSYNAFFGNASGDSVTSGSYNIILGAYNGAGAPISQTGSNYIVFSDGGGNVRGYFNAGAFYLQGIASGAGTNALKYDTATKQVTYDTSSIRYKTNVRDSIYGLDAVMRLKSVMFEYKNNGRTDVGLIAEDVNDVIPELAPKDELGRPDTVSYDRMVSVLIKAVQELKHEFDEYKSTHP